MVLYPSALQSYIRSLIVTLLLISQPAYVYAQPWQLQKDELGIRVYLREVINSDIKEFRGEIRIKASLGSLLAVMNDTDACVEWVHNCADPVLLKKISFNERYIYQTSKMPLFITDRGIIFQTLLSQNADSKIITMQMKAFPEYCTNLKTKPCQLILNSDLIVITRSNGFYKFIPEPGGWTRVIWQQHIEPGGSLPGWLINSLLLDLPFNTLSNLREIVLNHKYSRMRLRYGPDGIATGFKNR